MITTRRQLFARLVAVVMAPFVRVPVYPLGEHFYPATNPQLWYGKSWSEFPT